MKTESLDVIANARRMGRLDLHQARLTFHYDPDWPIAAEAYPLSISMPLTRDVHAHETVEPWLWGLLPDNPRVLEQWGRQFQVSPRNVFRLLENVGEDCAGTVQFVLPEKAANLLATEPNGGIQWLEDEDLTTRVDLLLKNQGLPRLASDLGQFSLAGAQPKIALHRDPQTGKWGIPYGARPTTHILKPANPAFDGFVENEHFCLSTAAALGLPCAESAVIHLGSTPVIAITRYDRITAAGATIRVHQEDFCQARSIHPDRKYQHDGGPSVAQIADVIWDYSSDAATDVRRFADALVFAFLTGNTDAHAKNFSLLIAGNQQVRLAPLYDLASVLPYPRQVPPRKAKMAMKIGSEYRMEFLEPRHWRACAAHLRIPSRELLERMRDLAGRAAALAPSIAQRLQSEGIHHAVVDQLARALVDRSHAILERDSRS